MGDFDRTVKMFKDAINRKGKQTAPLDVQAVVQGLDGDTAWVTFAGSEIGDTPVRRTIDCKPGDTVQVRSSGGKAWIVGNSTAPPTDDTKASQAKTEAISAQKSVKSMERTITEQQEKIATVDETAVTGVVVQYAKSTSPTSAPVSGWSSASPVWETGKYIWQRTVTTIAGEQIVSNVACIQGAKGEQGQKGADGTSVTILGHYDTFSELIAEHPTGSIGDSYLVGGDLYVWNGNNWEDVGTIQGPQGVQGEKGDKGDQGDQGAKGDTGVGVSALTAEYYLSTSEGSPTGGAWQSSPPAYVEGRYYWTRTKITWTTGAETYTTEVLDNGMTNANSKSLQALRVAGTAQDIAEATGQYFWTDDDGVHISSEPELPAATRNSIWNSLGMLFRRGLNPILGILTGDNPRVAIYDGQGSATENEVASFGETASIGKKDDYNIKIAPERFELNSGDNNGNTTLFKVGASGNPTSETYEATDFLRSNDQIDLTNTPVSGTRITVRIIYISSGNNMATQTLSFTEGVYKTKSWAKGSVKYSSPNTFLVSGDILAGDVTYYVSSNSVDLGILQFGGRRNGSAGNNSATLGNGLLAPYPYQTIVGRHNVPVDAPFVVGIGTPSVEENGFTVDWNGDFRSPSPMGLGLTILHSSTVVYDCASNFAGSDKSMDVRHAYVALCGRMCQLVIVFTNRGSVASGGDFVSGRFNGACYDKTAPPNPRLYVNGASYYGKTSIVGSFSQWGSLFIRNASPDALTIASSKTATIAFTYIVEDQFCTP